MTLHQSLPSFDSLHRMRRIDPCIGTPRTRDEVDEKCKDECV